MLFVAMPRNLAADKQAVVGLPRGTVKKKEFQLSRSWLVAGMAGVVILFSACANNQQDQVVADLPIAYIVRPIPIVPNSNPPVPEDPDVRDPLAFSAGGDVYIRENASPSASSRNITSCITGGTGDVKDLESSYDGQKLIFSLRLEDPDPNDDVVPSWNIYEYDIASGGCPHRIIFSDVTAEEGDDLGPAYLPDGRIVFTSSRQQLTGAIQLDEGKPQFPPLEEDQRVPNLVLHVMNSSGTGIQQISFNQSHDLDPTVLSTGEILFSRWDHMGGSNAVNLYKIRPDGTELKLVYGAHGHDVGTNGSNVQFLSPRETENGRILAMLKPFANSAGGGVPVMINASQYADIRQPLWPYQGALSGSGQVNAVSLNVTTDGSISRAGHFRSIYPLLDNTNRALVSWTQCRLQRANGDIDPCTGTIPAGATEAFPIYGIYVYDLDTNTQLPVVLPREGFILDEPVVIAPRPDPAILFDKAENFGLDSTLLNEKVGLLHIRSVYDFDGGFNSLGGAAVDLAAMADPTITNADGRPARFLRLVKGAYIPDDNTHDFLDRTAAFGRSNGRATAIRQGMREILGYVPVEPDGSVLTKVPANVPFTISVVDKDGRRIGGRHQNWLQVKAGEILECNGCHDHNPTAPSEPLPHGYSDAPLALNQGAAGGMAFPGTTTDIDPDPMVVEEILPEFGETMAQARIRSLCPDGSGGISYASVLCPELSPMIDPDFSDVWANGVIPDVIDRRYTDLTTPIPDVDTSISCPPYWSPWKPGCRTVINYEEHIHPLWSLPRAGGTGTCTNCHTLNGAVPPAAQLELTDGPSDQEPNHYKSYRELVFQDNEVDANGLDILVFTGNLIDPDTGLEVIDPITGLPIPVFEPVPAQGPAISLAGSRSSTRFFDRFFAFNPATDTVDHSGLLTPAEIRLLSEWVDMGAQYYNNPFDAPVN